MLHARLGDKDEAFQWLEKAYQERSHSMAFIKTEPMFDSLHTNARFQDFIRRLGLPR